MELFCCSRFVILFPAFVFFFSCRLVDDKRWYRVSSACIYHAGTRFCSRTRTLVMQQHRPCPELIYGKFSWSAGGLGHCSNNSLITIKSTEQATRISHGLLVFDRRKQNHPWTGLAPFSNFTTSPNSEWSTFSSVHSWFQFNFNYKFCRKTS